MLVLGLIPISIAMIVGGAISNEIYITYSGFLTFPIACIFAVFLTKYREEIRQNIHVNFGESTSPLYLTVYGCISSAICMLGGIASIIYGVNQNYDLAIYLGATVSIIFCIFTVNMFYYYYYWRNPPADDF